MPSEATSELLVTEPTDLHKFRGATLEEAVAQARRQLGDDVTPRAAARLRQGGLLGFFAKDLGVEVTVSRGDATDGPADDDIVAVVPSVDTPSPRGTRGAPSETVDSVLERLVGHATAIERAPVEPSARAEPAREPVFAQLLARALDRPPAEPGTVGSLRDSGVSQSDPTPAAAATAGSVGRDTMANALAAASASIAEQIGDVVGRTMGRHAANDPVIVVPVVIVVDADGKLRHGAPAF